MSLCSHRTLLKLHGNSLALSDRLRQLASKLSSRCPSSLLLIGAREKELAWKAAFPLNARQRSTNGDLASVVLESTHANDSYPIYLVDVQSDNFPPHLSTSNNHCHEETSYLIERKVSLDLTMRNLVISQLLFLFAGVVCIFADDLEGLSGVEQCISEWCRAEPASNMPLTTRPRLVIVTSSTPCAIQQLEEQMVITTCSTDRFRQIFSGYQLIYVDEDQTATQKYNPLAKTLFLEIDEVRCRKLHQRCQFSATHLAWLFRRAVTHFCRGKLETFDILRTVLTRGHRINGITIFASEFVSLCQSHGASLHDISSILASCILKRIYPPGSHRFAPETSYDAVFASQIQELLAPLKVDHRLVRQRFLEHFQVMIKEDCSGDVLHRKNLRTMRCIPWRKVLSCEECFFCFMDAPEHVMKCGHAICEQCVQSIGKVERSVEYGFRFDTCWLCERQADLQVMLKPPTAGARLLAFDGGGCRGIVALEMVSKLQQMFKGELQDYFDLVCGTSSGGIITLGLFRKRWTTPRCIQLFKDFTSEIFKRSEKATSLSHNLRKYLRLVKFDSLYDNQNLENCLKKVFGEDDRLFGYPAGGISRHKIGIPACEIRQGQPYIFTNYNGRRDCRRKGYTHFRPGSESQGPRVWEVGRITTAAPMYFKPAEYEFGTFQDIAMTHNNPIELCFWECDKIWPRATTVDIVLSIGTGDPVDPNTPGAPPYRSLMQDNCAARLVRVGLHSMRGNLIFDDFVKTARSHGWTSSELARCFRLDIPICQDHVAIDRPEAMEELQRSVDELDINKEVECIRSRLIASSFFFELAEYPERLPGGRYQCRGQICVRGNPAKIFTMIYKPEIELWLRNQPVGLIAPTDLEKRCCHCSNYRLGIMFDVNTLDEKVDLAISINHEPLIPISGFPQSIGHIITRQGLGLMEDAVARCQCVEDAKRMRPGPKRRDVKRSRSAR